MDVIVDHLLEHARRVFLDRLPYEIREAFWSFRPTGEIHERVDAFDRWQHAIVIRIAELATFNQEGRAVCPVCLGAPHNQSGYLDGTGFGSLHIHLLAESRTACGAMVVLFGLASLKAHLAVHLPE
jgi:hypothetical protein